ncbi:MAG: tRNA (5-methylaminomethyl-2-thiouridine)(34)-methyltransferase MnmD [Saprospiraceae bacterium]
MCYSVVETSDNSKTIYDERFKTNFHSINGAFQESKHIFIESAMGYYIDKQMKDNIKILEFGFGTGLNMLLTLDYAIRHNISIEYHSIEKFILNKEIIEKLSYCETLNLNQFEGFYFNIFNDFTNVNKYDESFIFKGYLTDFIEFSTNEKYDLIYFDAFGPTEHPEVWQKPFLNIIPKLMTENGILTTFSVKGSFRRDLKSLGLDVEKIPGPLGKREITRAIKKSG